MDYDTPEGRNRVLPGASLWMHLENITGKKTVATDRVLKDSINVKCPEGKSVQTERRLEVARSWQKGELRVTGERYWFLCGVIKMFWNSR